MIVPGKDDCPNCGANPLIYEAVTAPKSCVSRYVCSKCQMPGIVLEGLARNRKTSDISNFDQAAWDKFAEVALQTFFVGKVYDIVKNIDSPEDWAAKTADAMMAERAKRRGK